MAHPQATNVRIVSVVWFNVLPPKFGGQKAVALFTAHLAEHAPLLCLCSGANKGLTTGYQINKSLPVGKVQFLNPFVWRKIYTTAKRNRCTHLILEFPYHGIAGMLCKRVLKTKLIVHAHNVEYLRFKEGGKKGWQWLYRLEKWTMKKADLVLFTTEKDLRTAQNAFELKEEKVSVVPYGVEDRKPFDKRKAQALVQKRHNVQSGESILFFAGTLDYAPNADAVLAIVEQLIPLLNETPLRYKVIVCGRNRFVAFQYLNRLQNEKLVMAGEVEDIQTYFEAADVFINPVVTGGGVQTKTMDALSYHLNAVCFASKTAGIGGAGPKVFSVADGDWKAFADAVVTAAENSLPTPPLFFQTYNWRTIAAEAFERLRDC